ncbi:tyrosine-type recombinase/integrase [Rhodococcus koreensis]
MSKRKGKLTRAISPRKDADGNVIGYHFRITTGHRDDGRPIRERHSFATQVEAIKAYDRISAEVESGRHTQRSELTVAEYIEQWLAGKRKIRPVTAQGYRHALQPFVDSLGNVALQKLTRADIDRVVNQRLAGGRRGPALSARAQEVLAFVRAAGPGGVRFRDVTDKFGEPAARTANRLRDRGLIHRPGRGRYVAVDTDGAEVVQGVAASTAAQSITVLSNALAAAVDDGLIPRNPARRVERPQQRRVERTVWTETELARFREATADHRLAACWLMVTIGMRRSEVAGIRWRDVDLGDHPALRIEQGRVETGNGRIDVSDLKSDRSRRTLPLDGLPELVSALRKLKARQAEEKLAAGRWDDRTGLLWVDERGAALRPSRLSEEFRLLVAEAGLPRCRLHDARHAVASVLVRRFAPHVVAAWLGHSVEVLLRVYAWAYAADQVEVGRALSFG